MEINSVTSICQDMHNKADLLYEFILKYYDLMQEPTDYGTGEKLNMLEVHLLTHIDEHPGVTVSELAKLWGRTKGAISQQIKKLEEKKYITKSKDPSNGKQTLLHATTQGNIISEAHRRYDTQDILLTLNALLKHCTLEEIDTFYKVTKHFLDIIKEEA